MDPVASTVFGPNNFVGIKCSAGLLCMVDPHATLSDVNLDVLHLDLNHSTLALEIYLHTYGEVPLDLSSG